MLVKMGLHECYYLLTCSVQDVSRYAAHFVVKLRNVLEDEELTKIEGDDGKQKYPAILCNGIFH